MLNIINKNTNGGYNTLPFWFSNVFPTWERNSRAAKQLKSFNKNWGARGAIPKAVTS